MAEVAGATAVVVLLAALAPRLLGLRVGRTRAAAAAFAGLVVGGMAVGAAAQGPQQRPGVAAGAMVLGLAVFAAMGFLVAAEAVAPPGARPWPLVWVGTVRGRLRRARRYSQISALAVRHGFGAYLRGRRHRDLDTPQGRALRARSLREALEAGGVTFVKLGQLLSSRCDLLPPEFVDELSRLHDRAAPEDWERVRRLLAEELGAPPETLFTTFDREPLAAASIAQVHQARLPGPAGVDLRVAVKVQRPGIRPIVEQDLDILLRIAGRLDERAGWAGRVGVLALANGLAAALREELDFRIEAANLQAVAAATGQRGGEPVHTPAVHTGLGSSRVLVMEWLDGLPLADAGPLIEQRGLDRARLASDLLGCLLRQILLDGVFHADPHPGNVMLLRDGRLALLDYGAVGRLDTLMQAALQRILLAVDQRDPAGLREGLLGVVQRPDQADEQQVERALGRFLARHLGPGRAPGAAMFTDLFRLLSDHGLAVPGDVAAAFRALATLEGTLRALDPYFDIVAESRALAAAQRARALSPAAVQRTASEELATLVPTVRSIAHRTDRIAGALGQGRLSVNVRLFAHEDDRRIATGALHQTLLAFLGAALGIMAALLLGGAGGPRVTPALGLHQVLGYGMLTIGSMLMLRVLATILRPRR
jgi:ubiquinone biosynthesis protein